MQTCDPSIHNFEVRNDQAREKLWRTWNNGTLAHHAALLRNFASQRRKAIQSMTSWSHDPEAPIAAIKCLVVEEGTVHFASEMLDQQREIHNDIWYHGQRGDYDRKRIANEWPLKHGANWRRWRITEYLFVIDRIAEELAGLCRDEGI